MTQTHTPQTADICIIVEGSYPYVPGGVSSWVHQLVEAQKDKTFHIVSIISPTQDLNPRYDLPSNVISLKNIRLQDLPGSYRFKHRAKREAFYQAFQDKLQAFMVHRGLPPFKDLVDFMGEHQETMNKFTLMDSEEAWEILRAFYSRHMSASSFIDFFWAWRNLFSSLYSIILAEIPPARLYHAICTGYAGIYMAKAKLEYDVPCLLTEHGIYTNERQIEITLADWIQYQKSFSLQMGKTQIDWDMKDFWMLTFEKYSKICYDACDEIITLYEGNKDLQLANGANPEKLRIIPNGIDYEMFSQIKRDDNHPPTVALIGRVVPIKDVQTFIQACIMVKEKIPQLKALIMGPTDEDQTYYAECKETVKYAGMEDTITFTGKVNIKDYLPIIDVSVLTSLSEAQPLVILEAGAAGVPSIATDVGSCRELLYGKPDEGGPNTLIKGGEVVKVGSADEVAEAMIKMLTNQDHLRACQETLKNRVYHHYNKQKIDQVYRDLYGKYLNQTGVQNVA